MKKAGFLLLITALANMGCVSLPRLWPEHKAPEPPAAAVQAPARPKPVVNPDQVDDGNAKEMAAALLDELNGDNQRDVPAAGQKPAADGKRK
jgi:hypothetical protein